MHVVSLSNCLADDTETKTQNLTHALHTHSAHRAAPPDERRARPRPAHHHKIAVIFSVWRRPRRGGTAASTNKKNMVFRLDFDAYTKKRKELWHVAAARSCAAASTRTAADTPSNKHTHLCRELPLRTRQCRGHRTCHATAACRRHRCVTPARSHARELSSRSNCGWLHLCPSLSQRRFSCCFFLLCFFCHGAKGVGERWAFAAFEENDFSRKGW